MIFNTTKRSKYSLKYRGRIFFPGSWQCLGNPLAIPNASSFCFGRFAFQAVLDLSGNYPAILNFSRTGRVVLM